MPQPVDRAAADRGQQRRRTRRLIRRAAYVAIPVLSVSGMLVTLAAHDEARVPTHEGRSSVESDAGR